MIRYFLVVLLLLVLSLPSFGQTESAQKVILEVNNLKSNGSLQDAATYLEKRETLFDFNNLLDKFIYNLQMGVMNYNLGNYRKAYPHLQITTQICDAESTEVFNPQNDFLITYYWLAICAYKIGESREEVLNKLHRAKHVFMFSQLTDTPIYKGILDDIETIQGDAYTFIRNTADIIALSAQGKYDEAIPYLENLLSEYPNSKSYLEKSKYIQALANCYVQTGKIKEAEDLYLSTINKLNELKAHNQEVYWNLCDGLGVVYMQLHNLKKAQHYSSIAKLLHEENLNFDDGYIRCLSNCAIIEQGLGHNALAKIYIDVALKQMRTNYKGYDKAIDSILVFAQKEELKNSKDFQESADNNLRIKPLIAFLSNAAVIYSNTGYRGEAIACIKESIKLSKIINEENPLVLNNLGTLYTEENKIEQADSCYKEAYKISKSFYEKDQIGYNLAQTKWLLNKKDAGVFSVEISNQFKNNLSSNFCYLTSEERNDYWTQIQLYLPVFNLIMYQTDNKRFLKDIYDNILFEKDLLLRSSNIVRNAILTSNDTILIEKFNQMLADQRQLINEKDKEQQFLLQNRIELTDKYLMKNVQVYEDYHSKCTWKDVASSLSNTDIAIEFYNIPYIIKSDSIPLQNGEPRLCALVLKPGYNEPHMIPLCLESRLEGINGKTPEELKKLNTLIWEPLEKELEGVKRIYFSPYRICHALPIEYLVDEDGNIMNEKYEMYRLSTTRLLVSNKTKSREYKDISLYGGLLYEISKEELISSSSTATKHHTKRTVNMRDFRYGVRYLPGTKLEVNNIFNLFKRHNINPHLYCGLDGTEETFKQLSGKPLDILHMSTHGFYWSDEELESKKNIPFLNLTPISNESMNHTGLFMTGANITLKGQEIPDYIEDGILTAQEISSSNLENVDLVVLSACQTALGKINNDAVYGLQRGFKLAGVKTLLVSLWKVDDKATMVLMTEFYRQLLKGKSKIESLQIAQRLIQNKYGINHPEYWAGFILLDALR